jgi:hypothetical protein
MSKIALEGNASGTGTFTVAAPNSSSNFTLTLPTNTGTIITQNSTPAFASTIGVGGATAAASGAGITFPASASASSDANTLDDYEEGTWTPGYSAAAGIVTYSQQKGVYTKIGDTVFVSGFLQTTATSGASGSQVFITGLPFAAGTIGGSNGYSVLVSRANGWVSAPIGGMALSSQTYFEIYDFGSNNNTSDSVGTDIGSAGTTSIWFALYYKV